MWNEFLGAVALGLLWTLMTCGVYISYRVLDIADLTVEGSLTIFYLSVQSLLTACLDDGVLTLLPYLVGTDVLLGVVGVAE